MHHCVLGNTHPDASATRMLEASRNVTRRRQQEGVASGHALLDDSELPVVQRRVTAYFGEIAAHQREMVFVIDATKRPDALCGGHVADRTAERVARVRRIGDDPSSAHDRRRLAN